MSSHLLILYINFRWFVGQYDDRWTVSQVDHRKVIIALCRLRASLLLPFTYVAHGLWSTKIISCMGSPIQVRPSGAHIPFKRDDDARIHHLGIATIFPKSVAWVRPDSVHLYSHLLIKHHLVVSVETMTRAIALAYPRLLALSMTMERRAVRYCKRSQRGQLRRFSRC